MRMHFYLPRSVLRLFLLPTLMAARDERGKETEGRRRKKNSLFFFFSQKKTLFQLKSLLESKFRTIDDFRVETERREAEATAAVAAAAKAKEEEKSKA